MPVFRVERNKGYTVMSNYHLRDKSLSLKAKGLLSHRTDPGALRCSGECAVVFPLLHISRFQKFPHQGDKMFVLDTSAEDFNQNVVVEAIKAGGNVALNHPVDARKVSLNFF